MQSVLIVIYCKKQFDAYVHTICKSWNNYMDLRHKLSKRRDLILLWLMPKTGIESAGLFVSIMYNAYPKSKIYSNNVFCGCLPSIHLSPKCYHGALHSIVCRIKQRHCFHVFIFLFTVFVKPYRYRPWFYE